MKDQPENKAEEQRTLIIAGIFLVAIAVSLNLSILLSLRGGEWQSYVWMGIVLISGLSTLGAIFWIRRGRIESGILLILSSILGTLLVAALLFTDIGLELGLLQILITIVVVIQTLPRKKAQWTIGIAAIIAATTYGLDFLPLNYRLPVHPTFTKVLPVIAGIVILTLIALFLQQIFRGSSLRNKVIIPPLIIAGLIFFGLVAYNATTSYQTIIEAEDTHLVSLYQFFNQRVGSQADMAVALAIEVAENPMVQEAFANQDREQLIEITLPSYLEIDEQFDVPQHQFHLPPATSFLRLHQLNHYGDDLSDFRFTVLTANDKQIPIKGVEIGRAGLGVRGVVPVRYEGKHIGTVEFGLNVGEAFLNDLKTEYQTDWQLWLLQGPAEIASFVSPDTDHETPQEELLFQAGTIETSIIADADNYNQALNGEIAVQRVETEGVSYAVLSAPLYDFSGQVIGVIDIISDQTALIQRQNQQALIALGILIVTLTLVGIGVFYPITRMLQPVTSLTQAAHAVTEGDFSHKVKVETRDELGILAEAFNQMNAQIQDLINTLEEQVADRTRALETSTEVSRRLSTILDQEQLVKEVVEQLVTAFKYYYAHIYLFDEDKNTLIMKGGTGEAGQVMLSRGHTIQKGHGLVGRAAESNKVILVGDTLNEEGWQPNELLPETRSEVAIPIAIGDNVLGVFDVQHNIINGITEEDATLLQSIANQVAIAVQNAQAYTRAQRQADRETHITEISQQIQQATTIDEVMKIAVSELGQVLDAKRASVELSINTLNNDKQS